MNGREREREKKIQTRRASPSPELSKDRRICQSNPLATPHDLQLVKGNNYCEMCSIIRSDL